MNETLELKNEQREGLEDSPFSRFANVLQDIYESRERRIVEKTADKLGIPEKMASLEARLRSMESDNRSLLDLLSERLPKMNGLDDLLAQHSKLLDGFMDSRVMDLFRGIIPVLDRVEARLYVLTNLIRTRKYLSTEATELVSFLKGVRIELIALLSANGIEQFATGEKTFSGKHHQATKFVTSDDPSLDGTIFRSLKPAYRRNGTVIRPEIVEVYRYEKDGGKELQKCQIQ